MILWAVFRRNRVRKLFEAGEALPLLPVPHLGKCRKPWLQEPSEVVLIVVYPVQAAEIVDICPL